MPCLESVRALWNGPEPDAGRGALDGDAKVVEARAEMAVRAGEYGPVLILKGEHAGEVGYYDDDDVDDYGSDGPDAAVIYLGEPFVSDYILIPHADLEKVDAASLELERWKRKYPWLAKYLGIP
jgi:hypothetical protein